MERFTYFCYHYFWGALDWVFPPSCSGCGKLGRRWCSDCEAGLVPLRNNICDICGYLIENGTVCSRCAVNPPEFTMLRSVYEYQGGLRNAIHRLKYDNDLGVGEILGRKCADHLERLHWKIDLVIPVPLGKKRRKERGYNQAAMIAYPMSLMLGIQYGQKQLVRSKETVTQVEYNAEQRKQNVHEAFSAPNSHLKGKNILIIDDVITTGSTMDECARALKKAGVKNVYGLSVARTMIKGKLT